MDIYVLILPLLIGWILDKLLGDPVGLPHPVVGFGKLISFCEERWNCGAHRMLKGGGAAIMLILLVYVGSALALHYLFLLNRWLGIALSAVLVFYCLAGTTLIREVKQVFLAADRSLEEGRKQVSRIVGRDTSELTDQEVRIAALETLAENLSDGVIAPLFWYLLLGVPGMLAYKMVNTLDSMGGGGKGMRLIHSEDEVVEAYNTARSESMSSFGDDTVYLEKFVEEPHHIEFQILGDNHGNVIHLFDRECSVQRRNQKIVEESPSPFLTPELRQEMGEKAVAAARAVNYSGAGTIEFLVDKNRDFYFLEMNTRLQVEHPITEEVVGVDLVKEQIRIANNEVLHLKQEELFQRGHAIECRICAEDTENNFMPSPGIIKQLTEPNGIGVRIDSYVYEGYEIPIYYDPMIGKLIVWATTRQYAIERMRRVLYEYKITGLKTNLSYLKRIMHTPDFVKGEYNTLFIEKNSRMLLRGNGNNEEIENIAMIASYIDYLMNLEENKSPQLSDARPISRWREFGLQKGVLRI